MTLSLSDGRRYGSVVSVEGGEGSSEVVGVGLDWSLHESWFGRSMVGSGTLVLRGRRRLLLLILSLGRTARWDVPIASWVRTELLLLRRLRRAILLRWFLGVVGVRGWSEGGG